MIRMSETATWLITSTWRSREPRTPELNSPRSALVSVRRVACSAGRTANTIVASAATIAVNRNTR
jgi:hypothetical protein